VGVEWRALGTAYRIRVRNPEGVCRGVRSVTLDGRAVAGAGVPRLRDGGTHDVEVVLGAEGEG